MYSRKELGNTKGKHEASALWTDSWAQWVVQTEFKIKRGLREKWRESNWKNKSIICFKECGKNGEEF